MSTFQKTVTCVVCQQEGTAIYKTVGAHDKASRLQSLDCPGGCWAEGAPGAEIIRKLNAAPVVER